MSIVENYGVARLMTSKSKLRALWRSMRLGQSNGAGDNPYSPVLCISLLLLVGAAVKLGPVVQAHLAAY